MLIVVFFFAANFFGWVFEEEEEEVENCMVLSVCAGCSVVTSSSLHSDLP